MSRLIDLLDCAADDLVTAQRLIGPGHQLRKHLDRAQDALFDLLDVVDPLDPADNPADSERQRSDQR